MNVFFRAIGVSLVALVPLGIASCYEEIPAGLKTSVHGRVFDTLQNKALEGVMVKVCACKHTFMGLFCADLVDSTRTNQYGAFRIAFITAGDASGYEVSVVDDDNYIFPSSDTVMAGGRNEVTLYATALKTVQVYAQIENNSVGVIEFITPPSNYTIIYKHTRDTVIYGKVIPLQQNFLSFRVYDTTVHQVNGWRVSVDTLDVGLLDTTYFLKRITDPKDWPLAH